MAACLSLALAGPAVAWMAELLARPAPFLAGLSPFSAVLELMRTDGGAMPTATEWQAVISQFGAAAVAWVVVIVMRLARGRRFKQARM